MPVNPYDEVPYLTFPQEQTHPDRLATVGTLFGMTPAPVAGCRMLEIGCGDATNLIPMAYALPESQFIGIDLAETPILAGRRIAEAMELPNLRLECADILNVGTEYGQFDYIVAHGVYSWVPSHVRDGLMELCARLLAPQGIAFISYNTFPGRHLRHMLREMMLHHTRHQTDSTKKVEEARWFLEFLLKNRVLPEAWDGVMEAEIRTMLKLGSHSLFHDDLATFSQPFYFHEFAEHAARNGLQFLGEAEPHTMFDPTSALDWLQDDILQHEQYMDFLRGRRFRQTLLCRAGIPLNHKPASARMEEFWFSAPSTDVEDGGIRGLRGIVITSPHPAVRAVAGALGDVYPMPLSFEDLVPYAGGREPLREILFGLMVGGFANMHVFDYPCEDTVTERPKANRLVRYQALQSKYVTSVCHHAVELDEVGRQLLLLMDGTRDHEELARDLAAIPGAPSVEQIREHLLSSLEWMAQRALLEA